MKSVFSAVDSISKELASIIQSKEEIPVTEKEEINGVSHSSIDTVIRTTLKHNLTSKLTGAGGGGCVLTLLPTVLRGNLNGFRDGGGQKWLRSLSPAVFSASLHQLVVTELRFCF
ncbi:hypothetical protein Rs2_48420 [Raphanus sativus]|nr:hypothetical protein Rs2_48420 [Raphanus sativus]